MATKKKSSGMTLPQLAAKTSLERIERARYVKILKTKVGHDSNGLGFIAAQTTSTKKVDSTGRLVRNINGSKYITMFTFIDSALHVHASCSCEDNTFVHEYANTQRGASNIEYSNGDAPVIKNPRLRVGLCKHAYALYTTIRSKLQKQSS